jgi:hypothetical protein
MNHAHATGNTEQQPAQHGVVLVVEIGATVGAVLL